LGGPTATLKTESRNALTTTSTDIWQRNAETRKCFKCDKEEHIAKDCKGKQVMKSRKVQEESDDEDDKKEEGFGNNLE